MRNSLKVKRSLVLKLVLKVLFLATGLAMVFLIGFIDFIQVVLHAVAIFETRND